MPYTQRQIEANFPPYLLDALRAYGTHPLAYSIRQPGMSYFWEDNLGVIAYRKRLGQCVVLGDPVCAPENKKALLEKFMQQYPKALYMQIGRDTLDFLRNAGYRSTPVGVENSISVDEFSLAGKRKADLRHYRNKAHKAKLEVEELEDTRDNREMLLPVSNAWLPGKSWFAHELEFLARPYQCEPEPGTRVFVSKQDGNPVAFVELDPMWKENKAIGYVVSILRHVPHAPEGAVDHIIFTAIEKLKEENIPYINLGISPFYKLQALAHQTELDAYPVYWLYHLLYHFGNPIYHFKGLSFHKSRYRADEAIVYTAVPGYQLAPALCLCSCMPNVIEFHTVNLM